MLSVSCRTSESSRCRRSLWLIPSVIAYSPALLNGMNIVGSVAGGSGNLFVFLLQRKFRFATKVCSARWHHLRCLRLICTERCMLWSFHDPHSVSYTITTSSYSLMISNLWGAVGAGTMSIGFHKGKFAYPLILYCYTSLTPRMGVLACPGLEFPDGCLGVVSDRFPRRARSRS